MPSKSLVMLGMVAGSTIGGYIPTMLGADFLSLWGILGSILGGLLGIYLTYKSQQ